MKILITGAEGFIGKNLCASLSSHELLKYDIDTDPLLLSDYCRDADFVIHLAGINRPKDESEFTKGNTDFTATLLKSLLENNNPAPILMMSSIQAALDNPYGRSKKAAEDLLRQYSDAHDIPVYIYRLPNVFGKWCKPNYNSVVATFCHNIANGLDITVNDPNAAITLVYVDDIIEQIKKMLSTNKRESGGYFDVPVPYNTTVGEIAQLIYSFKESRETKNVADMSDGLTKKLYSTYLTYLPEDEFSYLLHMNIDARGSFTEFIRTPDRGQYSVNISKPGITKGNHWHHSKNEKFLVVYGEGIIRFRSINSDQVIEYSVSGEDMRVVDIPPGYTHNIENTGSSDMVTIMWANECFDPDMPDTYRLEV